MKNGTIEVSLIEPTVTVDFRTGTAITLFSKNELMDVSIVLRVHYSAVKIDANHYK